MSTLGNMRRAMNAEAKRRQRLYWTVLAAVLAVLPWVFSSSFAVSIMTQIGIASIFALSYNMLLGQGGMLSFGHAVYFGLGGFLAMHFMNYIEGGFPLPVPLLPIIGGLIGLLFGVIFGSFSTRRAGTVFAMISLGIAELIASSSLIFVKFFGGEEGITGDRTMGAPFLDFNYATDIEVYYIAAIWTFIAMFAMYWFSRSPMGRMANAVRENPERAEFIGYSQRKVRLISFCASGFFAGLAGGIFAIAYEIVTEETLGLNQSGSVLLMAYIGGIGYFIGPVIGAILLTLLRTVLSNFTDIWLLYLGLIFLATVLFAPAGLSGLLMMHGPAYKARRMGLLLVPYATMAIPILITTIGITGILELAHFAQNTSVDDRVMMLYGIPSNIDSLLPWAVLVGLAGIGIYGIRRAKAGVLEAWDQANAPIAPGGQDKS
ncbi:MAG TPA: branched-chain amino acid ABC transporter permease [Rhodospirillales bacterium]|nr:branched-chain amino acid ABC transporter permease [Rhodospirillales bacterium]